MEQRWLDQLKKFPLFSSLSHEELESIASKITIKRFRRNEIILHEDDTTYYMYVVLEGRVKAVQTTADGKEVILAVHQTGGFFGEMSLIDGKTAPATVVAVREAVIAVISKREFHATLLSNTTILNNLLLILCSRLRDSWYKIQMLNLRSAAQRVKTLLHSLSHEHGLRSGDGVTLQMKLTHQDMADMTGLTRETVTRVIDRWLEQGEVTVRKDRTIHMKDSFLKSEFDDLLAPLDRER